MLSACVKDGIPFQQLLKFPWCCSVVLNMVLSISPDYLRLFQYYSPLILFHRDACISWCLLHTIYLCMLIYVQHKTLWRSYVHLTISDCNLYHALLSLDLQYHNFIVFLSLSTFLSVYIHAVDYFQPGYVVVDTWNADFQHRMMNSAGILVDCIMKLNHMCGQIFDLWFQNELILSLSLCEII